MATHVSSIKRARQSIRRNEINRGRKSKVHNLVRAVETALAANKPEEALKALRIAEASIASTAGKGTMSKKTAARKTSRLAQRVRRLSKA